MLQNDRMDILPFEDIVATNPAEPVVSLRTFPEQRAADLSVLPSPQLTILDESYSEALCALERRCYSHPWSAELIRGEFRKEISLRLGLVVGGPSGSDSIVAYSFNYIVADELHVLNLAVHPDFRGRGHGKQLLSAVLKYAVSRGATYATLEVRQSNAIAKTLYSSMGFEVVGIRKNYYRDNLENALVLEMDLGNLPAGNS
jgi:ribosomal-protein-alanine N-acetyltransferase